MPFYKELAERWEVSPDGLNYTFKIRTGVTFHNGKPLTSADVKFTLLEISSVSDVVRNATPLATSWLRKSRKL